MSNYGWLPLDVADNTTRSVISDLNQVDNASTAHSTQPKEIWNVPLISWVSRPNSFRNEHFFQLWETIDRMRRLPEHHQYHLNSAVANKAILFLNEISNNYEGQAPLLLPEDHNNIAFTWEKDLIKTFVNLYAEEQDLLTLNKRSQVSCDIDLPDDFSSAMNEIIQILSFPPRARSSVE